MGFRQNFQAMHEARMRGFGFGFGPPGGHGMAGMAAGATGTGHAGGAAADAGRTSGRPCSRC